MQRLQLNKSNLSKDEDQNQLIEVKPTFELTLTEGDQNN